MPEVLFQGKKDVFLAKIRAQFDAVEDQALKSLAAIREYKLADTDPMAQTLYTEVSNVTNEGDRAVWRHISIAGIKDLGNRRAGGIYPEVEFPRGFETEVLDPDHQIAGQFVVPEEREAKEGTLYRSALGRASKLLSEITRVQMQDMWELFNLAFTAPTSYPVRFFGKALKDGLDQPLISSLHQRADSGPVIDNTIRTATLADAFSDAAYWKAREQGATLVDDVGKQMPMFGGKLTIVVPPANDLVRTAIELAGSEYKVNTANNDINVHFGTFANIKSSPYLLQSAYLSGVSNQKAWFLVDENVRDPEVGTGLVKINFVPLTSRVERLETNDSVVYKLKWESVMGWVDFRNFIGSPGDGAAYTL